jgi:hypothetical protein
MKKCTICKSTKSIDEFYKDSQKSSGLSPRCKQCDNIQRNDWNLKNKEKRRFAVLKCATGIEKEEYLKILSIQDNKCAICKLDIKNFNKNLSVDHCHNTNLVRGLLCTKCNIGLGYFNDNIELLSSAMNYLNNNYNYMNIKYKEKDVDD